jgi:hypothetical protein
LGFGAVWIWMSIPTFRRNTTPSGEPWKGLFSPLFSLHTQPPPCNLPEGSLLVQSSSHIPFLWLAPFPQPLLFRSYISSLLPFLVTSTPEDGDSMFLRNVGIDLQIHAAPKPKTFHLCCSQSVSGLCPSRSFCSIS